jgi:hypothetical protein
MQYTSRTAAHLLAFMAYPHFNFELVNLLISLSYASSAVQLKSLFVQLHAIQTNLAIEASTELS